MAGESCAESRWAVVAVDLLSDSPLLSFIARKLFVGFLNPSSVTSSLSARSDKSTISLVALIFSEAELEGASAPPELA